MRAPMRREPPLLLAGMRVGREGLQIPPLSHSLAVVQAGRDLPCCSLLLLPPETDTGVRRHRLLDMSPGQLQDIRRQVGGQ